MTRYAPSSMIESKPCPPGGGILTSICAAAPVPIPEIVSTLILPKEYPVPPDVTVAEMILPPSTTIETRPPTPSPAIATLS